MPQRLIASWFEAELKGMPDYRRDAAIVQLSNERFQVARPLYRILEDGIELHCDWRGYLEANAGVVRGWSDARWLAYLSSRNPNVPGLVEKIAPRRPAGARGRAGLVVCGDVRGASGVRVHGCGVG